MNYSSLTDTYATERLKTLNVWSMFRDGAMDIRPHFLLERDRTAHAHMVHQCLSEDKWFRTMFGIEVGSPLHNALTINAYSDIASLLEGESQGGRKAALPGPGDHPSTERPDR